MADAYPTNLPSAAMISPPVPAGSNAAAPAISSATAAADLPSAAMISPPVPAATNAVDAAMSTTIFISTTTAFVTAPDDHLGKRDPKRKSGKGPDIDIDIDGEDSSASGRASKAAMGLLVMVGVGWIAAVGMAG